MSENEGENPTLASQKDSHAEATRAVPRQVTRQRHVIAVGGGRSGVGKTLLSVNLAVYLAQLGRQVVLCDADPHGSSLHTMLGLHQPPLALPEAMSAGNFEPAATSVPGLSLLPITYDRWTVTPKRPSRKSHWMAPLSYVNADYIVINLGSSTAPASLDVFFDADIKLCVAAPEPPAIEATYRFCRALFARRLRRLFARERFKLRAVEKALERLDPLPSPRELVAEIALFDEPVANAAAGVLRALRPGLIIGKTRLRRDLELGPAMSVLSERFLGLSLDYLGYIEQDDAVWLTARRCRPLLIDAPTSKSARNIERVARRLLALLAQPERIVHEAPLNSAELHAPMTLYDVLGVPRTASEDEIRRAYKLQREVFREGSLPIISLVDGDGVRDEQARIAEAYDTLLDPVRKPIYDRSTFPESEPAESAEKQRAPSGATSAELAERQAELLRTITPETQFTGALLTRAREARGIEIADIAQVTKISARYLRAIEAEDADALPATVYLRGFLQQIAKTLQLDAGQVTKTYVRRLRAAELDDQ
jgi:flagellar biosynthesis protein FlhG